MNDFTLLAMLMVAHRIDELDAQTSTDKEVRRAATMCLLLRKNTGVVGGWADTIQAYQVRPTQHENGQLEFPQFATRK
jgi:hypothetical protein